MAVRSAIIGGVLGVMVAATGQAAAQNPIVVIETNLGSLTIELFEAEAPISVENFLQYVDEGFFADTIFHRVIPNFMIQGGGFPTNMIEKETRGTIQNEANNGLSNARGTLAMARRPQPHSASAQFFINLVDNTSLNYQSEQNYGYAVFGRVTEGMEVLDKIAGVPTGNRGPHQNVPVDPVTIVSVTRQ